MSSSNAPSYFPTPALDAAAAGIAAGLVSTVCMQPLDLLKVKLQVSTAARKPGLGGAVGQMWTGLRDIGRMEGVAGLYRGMGVNLVGNASSWGFYFLWYTMLKSSMFPNQPGGKKLNAGQHLAASATSGVITAVMTNPLWVVKTRMFTTSKGSEGAYRGVLHGLYRLTLDEGLLGLSRGLTLAIIGVSNGALQFMVYEELKKRRYETRRTKLGPEVSEEEVRKLGNTEYVLMSGGAKLAAIAVTYPYQVVRSRIQYRPHPSPVSSLSTSASIPTTVFGSTAATASPAASTPSSPFSTPLTRPPTSNPPYRSIPDVLRRTYAAEGLSGFYKGIGTNAVRILPGTCVTFVVYERVVRWLEERGESGSGWGGTGRREVKEGG
ncbi:hypothetical protein JCM11641_007351 [Rhodosporidiobolus odoratus]